MAILGQTLSLYTPWHDIGIYIRLYFQEIKDHLYAFLLRVSVIIIFSGQNSGLRLVKRGQLTVVQTTLRISLLKNWNANDWGSLIWKVVGSSRKMSSHLEPYRAVIVVKYSLYLFILSAWVSVTLGGGTFARSNASLKSWRFLKKINTYKKYKLLLH